MPSVRGRRDPSQDLTPSPRGDPSASVDETILQPPPPRAAAGVHTTKLEALGTALCTAGPRKGRLELPQGC